MNTNKVLGWSAVSAAVVCFAVLGSTVVAGSSAEREVPAATPHAPALRAPRATEHLDAGPTLGQIVDLYPEIAALPLGTNGVRPCGISVDPMSVSSTGYGIALRNCSSIAQRRAPVHLDGSAGPCKDVTPYATQTWHVSAEAPLLELTPC